MEYLGFSAMKPSIFSVNSFELTAWQVVETIFLSKKFDLIYLEIKMARSIYKIDFSRKRYGATKWQYENIDCVDLYIELLILLNC